MRAVNLSQTGTATGSTRTMTQRLVALRPGAPDLIDAGFLVALTMVALLGFATTFDTPRYLVASLLGVVLGIVLAHLANVLRWPWLVVVGLAAVAYVGGGTLAARTGVLDVAKLAVTGWKSMLTVLAPLPGDDPCVALPYLLAVVVGACGFAAARRTRTPWPALVLPTLLVAGVILLGTRVPAAAVPVGLGYAVLAFGWLAVRATRRRRVVGTGSRSVVNAVFGAVILVAALAAGFFAGPFLPGLSAADRVVARTYVEPPVELPSYGSPLAGFRKFSSQKLAEQDPDHYYYDQELLRVAGDVPAGTLVRFAVMDDYSGTAWSATAGGAGTAATGFQRIGTQIPDPPDGATIGGTLTVGAAYAGVPDLQLWLPSFGDPTALGFEGPNAAAHIATLRYNSSTGQGLLPDALREGDVVDERAVPVPVLDLAKGADVGAGGAPLLGQGDLEFLASSIQKMVPADQDDWQQLKAAAAYLQSGYWSDGTGGSGDDVFRPGHGQARLVFFLEGSSAPVGSDEQYAATLGLVANSIGYPARVVMGAALPADGVIHGKDVTAWVEVLTDDGRWHAIAPSSFIPDRTKTPVNMPQQRVEQKSALDVPPPNPVQPPAAFKPQFNVGEHAFVTGNPWMDQLIATVLAILAWAGPPIGVIVLVVCLIVGAKARRRSRRRRRGAESTRIAGGWAELMDLARDLGHQVTPGTRREQTLAVGRVEFAALAQTADAAIFGPGAVQPADVSGYWTKVMTTRKSMLRSLGVVRRWRARLSLRSLMPLPTANATATRKTGDGSSGPTANARMTRNQARGTVPTDPMTRPTPIPPVSGDGSSGLAPLNPHPGLARPDEPSPWQPPDDRTVLR